jgi:hypothetical protein
MRPALLWEALPLGLKHLKGRYNRRGDYCFWEQHEQYRKSQAYSAARADRIH